MRGFFVLLLITNVAFLAWQFTQPQPGAEAASPSVSEAGGQRLGLTLLEELPPGQRPALREGASTTEGETAAVAGSDVTQRDSEVAEANTSGVACLRIGGIDGRERLDNLLETLRTQGVSALESGSEQGTKTNYWVMLPPYKDRNKAAEAAAILKAEGVKDFFIVRSGDSVNAVSLGVFSTRERARRRYEQIVGLGARLRKPKIEAMSLPTKRFLVSFKVDNDALRTGVKSALEEEGVKNMEEIPCR